MGKSIKIAAVDLEDSLGLLRTGTGVVWSLLEKRRNHRGADLLCFFGPSLWKAGSPRRRASPAGAALPVLGERVLAEHTGPGLSRTLLVGGLHISHGDSFHSLKPIWLSDSWLVLSPQITSFIPTAGGSCITAHQTWLLECLRGHLQVPMWMHCLPHTHWFLRPSS